MDSNQIITTLRSDHALTKYIVQQITKQEIKSIVSVEYGSDTLVVQAKNVQDQTVWAKLIFDH